MTRREIDMGIKYNKVKMHNKNISMKPAFNWRKSISTTSIHRLDVTNRMQSFQSG